MELKKGFGKIMREERQKQGLSQSELAQRVGITDIYCSDIEEGKYTATWEIWLKICVVLNIDIQKIIENYINNQLETETI